MNYEKKYKDALMWIESIYPTLSSEQRMEAEGVFPEIAESADERIRKAIIEHLRQDIELEQILSKEVGSDWIAWLEKQGWQNLANSAKICKEDEEMLDSIIEDFGNGKTSNMLQEQWLKSLKEKLVVK